ncbi:hypothetical protein NE237_013076 [Protea cynaroides]|uniref:Uncharacterized protein n=1 Tax=Protea cynaroides TaxID=273540 RepID=A0A9Q0GYM7_9MAGN|nr:hypothetical protein NE237_013076 [Protea cynaroides]
MCIPEMKRRMSRRWQGRLAKARASWLPARAGAARVKEKGIDREGRPLGVAVKVSPADGGFSREIERRFGKTIRVYKLGGRRKQKGKRFNLAVAGFPTLR